jgi:hypothetical protein
MALVIKDRVKQTTTTTGTGTLTLNGTVDGFQTFAAALSDGDTTYYALLEPSTNEWEVGLGTWTEGSSLLARTTVLASSNSGSAVNLTAQAEVFISQPAGKAAFFNADGDLELNQDPTSALHAATKEYVDTIAAAGLHYHDPVRVEQEGNLSATYDNGTAGVGATLTNNSTQAALVVDGVTLSLNDRVLIYEQTDATQNGVYTVTDTGSASTNWVLTRSTDTDSYAPSDPNSFGKGDAFFVLEGNAGAGELYVMNTEGTITFGTTNITFTQVASTAVYSAGNGLTLTGTVFAADAGTGVTVDGTGINIGQAVETTSDVTFNTVSAALTGNVTGNVTGDVTGNADTATALETARNIGGVSFDGTASINLPGVNTTGNQDTTGNAATATAWETGRTFELTGDVTGSVTGVDGSGNASIATTIAANSVALGTDTTGDYVSTITSGNYLTGGTSGEGSTPTLNVDATPTNTASKVVARDASGNFSAGTITAALSGNASTATALATGRTISLTGDVTGTSGSFDGSGNVSITATIADDSHNHVISNVDGLQTALDAKLASSSYTASDVLTKIKTVDGSGSGLDADLLDGLHESTFMRKSANSGLDMNNNNITDVEDIYLQDRIYHDGDTDTYIQFHAANEWRVVTGGTEMLEVNDSNVNISSDLNINGNLNAVDNIYLASNLYHEGDTDTYMSFGNNIIYMTAGNDSSAAFTGDGIFVFGTVGETYSALSGTTPTCNVDNGGAFSLTMSGNTTFTFSGANSGYSQGFVLQLTGNGSTVTWPSSVDWAGGTAPDAPASGETDIYVFWTRDGGTTWYGVHSIDAAA